MPSVLDISKNLERVREQIARSTERAKRDPATVRLVAVTKTFSAEVVRAAYECGLRDFGENRIQEFSEKLSQLGFPDARFHLIGHLQSNKASHAMNFAYIHTIDSERLARRVDEAAAHSGKTLSGLVQVKFNDDPGRSGVAFNDVEKLASFMASLEHLKLIGLMTLPPFTDDPEQARPYFRRMRELRDALREKGLAQVRQLSMGMTHDYPVAIEEGATMVRIGTAIFGPRPPATASASTP